MVGFLKDIAGSLIGGGSDLLGGFLDRSASKDLASRNYRDQKEFAQYGVRWRVDDAKAAGIAPLAALGANLHQYSPVTTGSSGLGGAVSRAGQNIGRAVAAAMTPEERMHQYEMNYYARENAQLTNDWMRTQIADSQRRLMFPDAGMSGGFPDAGVTTEVPGPIEAYSQKPADWSGNVLSDAWHTTSGPTAEEIERQYAEVPANIYGSIKSLIDGFYNAQRAARYMYNRHRSRPRTGPADPYGIYGGP